MEILKWILLIVGSYFIGNISFARFLSRLKKSDITRSGSGNPGAMNMLRTYGFAFGLLTLLLDVIKGIIPSLIGFFLFGGSATLMGTIGLYVGGLSCIIGHIYPVCYKFKGGKGIACTLGVFLVANPLWLLVFFVLAFAYLWFFDYGSIASLFVVSALTIIEGVKPTNYGNLTISLLLFSIFILTWFAHRSNIIRLLIGKENKANLQKSIKKYFVKQKTEIKIDYKQKKQEIKSEFRQDKLKYKEDKEKYKRELAKYKEEKQEIKREYKREKGKIYNYASIMETVKTEHGGDDNE